ncbi:putative reverse transcriptase domain-containing protein [Tanacetum coccineum]
MPIDNNKPPDPLIDELSILTKMTSADELCSASLNDTKVAHRGIKVSTPGSAGAGSVLRRLISAKVAAKARDRAEGSPRDDRSGKRVVSTPMNPEIDKVLSDFKSGSLNNNIKFAMGCSNDDSIAACSLNEVDSNDLCKGNDGSFINLPLDSNHNIGLQNSLVAKSCGLKTSHEHTSMGDVVNTGVGIACSKDGMAIAKTCILNEKGMAGSRTWLEHSSMEGVVNTRVAQTDSQNGIASYKVGNEFEFGSNEKSKGVLKNPNGSLFNVQFGKNTTSNPFAKKSVVPKGGALNNDGSNALGSRILSNQFSADVDRFAEKLKQGTEELALKMEYVPNSVSKLENGNRRISFSAEKVYKGGQACSLQLYDTLLALRWIIGCEEGMKKVLESGPWMIQNVPLVCVYNVPMELCNGNGIGKIMSGVGKPLLMDKMTRERCLKKARKIDFARVLVEVSAEEDLPNVLEIEYPPLGCSPAHIGKLEIKYQWKPPLCTHCKTFGHNTLSCKIHPRTKDEIAADAIKEAIKVKNSAIVNKISDENDGFITVGRKNKPIESRLRSAPVRNFNNKGGFLSGGQKQYGNNQGNNGGGNFRRNFQQNSGVSKQMGNIDVSKANARGNGKRFSGGDFAKKNNSTNFISKDPNFKPKVLVRGSGSNNDSKRASDESIPVRNSFNVLRDDSGDETEDISGFNVDEEF